jgi:hypothetical protein
MPNAPLRACRCGAAVRGRCPTCTKQQDQVRGTAARRGYDQHWVRFRPQFIAQLVHAGMLPVCGAALPSGPQTQDSQCQQHGVLTFTSVDGSSLHLDHEPPLEEWERSVVARVCDATRIQLLCARCHASKGERDAQVA